MWVTSVDGTSCVEVDELAFVEHLGGYEATIEGPPDLDGEPCVPSPPDLGGAEPLAVGLVTLLDANRGQAVEVSADPGVLLGWFAGEPGRVADLVVADGGAVAAAASGYLLAVTPDVPEPEPPYCRFDGLIDRGHGRTRSIPWTAVRSPAAAIGTQPPQPVPRSS